MQIWTQHPLEPALTACYLSQWPLSLVVQWLKPVSWIKSFSLPPACVLGLIDCLSLAPLMFFHFWSLLNTSTFYQPTHSTFQLRNSMTIPYTKGVSFWLKILLGLLNALQIKHNSRMSWPALHTHHPISSHTPSIWLQPYWTEFLYRTTLWLKGSRLHQEEPSL